jgi:signal peptidase I
MTKASGKRISVLIMVGTALFLGGQMFQPTVVVGESMAPTLRAGRVVYVDRTYYAHHKPRRGEVILFRQGDDLCIKRVYRAPGEKVTYIGSGSTVSALVGEASARELRQRGIRQHVELEELQVPDDCVYVLGDNYLRSEDSREFGPVPIRDIIGRAHLPTDPTVGWSVEYRVKPRNGRHTLAPTAIGEAAAGAAAHTSAPSEGARLYTKTLAPARIAGRS